ncbi:MAG TPA: choice-of-anchor tandem repeat GloVer-containing protein [Rhizomicrobium sp.]|jgi:uncharacterized repeat protein (TIGR03803 family)|nr:choice-of-anchor tandem repeat GloVer-containing protein [Rhizomicrobium sp.]
MGTNFIPKFGNYRSYLRVRAVLPCAIAALAAGLASPALAAARVTVLYTFRGAADGGLPQANLVADGAGNLYGTTLAGGIGSCLGFSGCGVVFKLAKKNGVWVETPLHAFTGGDDGGYPSAGVIADKAGNLYGTTEVGGAKYFGVVFKLTKNKGEGYTETVLHTFDGGPDGAFPEGSLIEDESGNLYGTTADGGDTSCNCGTVFKLTRNKGEGYTDTVLHSFTGVSGRDGAEPEAGLIEDKEANLYGTTGHGGFTNCITGNGCGTVFRIAPDGTETVLYAFSGRDGLGPRGSLIEDGAGNLYGTTVNDDVNKDGLVFELTPSGNKTTLHAFSGGSDGIFPQAGLFADKKGNLYGTTEHGGHANCGFKGWHCGTVFKLTKNKGKAYTEAVLHSFAGGSDGAEPWASLIEDTPDGKAELFGTTMAGGTGTCSGFDGCGVVFEIKE